MLRHILYTYVNYILYTYVNYILYTYVNYILYTYVNYILYTVSVFSKRKKEKKSIRHRYRGNEQLTIEDVCEKTPF
jgi:hypothetical protein